MNSLKRLVLVVGLAVLAVKLAVATVWPGTAGSPLDLLARVAASLADLGAVLLVFEVLRSRRPANRAARSAVLLAVSPALLVASAVHGDPAGVAVALLLLAMYLLVDRQAPLAAGLAVGVAARVDPLVLIAAPVALAVTFPRRGSPDRQALQQFGGALAAALLAGWAPALAWGWRAQQAPPPVTARAGSGPGGCSPGPSTRACRGSCSAPAASWCWPRRWSRPCCGCGAGPAAPTPPARPRLRRGRPGPAGNAGADPRLGAQGARLAAGLRLPGRRQVGEHLRRRGRRRPAVDLGVVGAGAAVGRRRRPGERSRRVAAAPPSASPPGRCWSSGWRSAGGRWRSSPAARGFPARRRRPPSRRHRRPRRPGH